MLIHEKRLVDTVVEHWFGPRLGSRHRVRFGGKGSAQKMTKKDAAKNLIELDLNEENHAKLVFSSVAKYEAARNQILDLIETEYTMIYDEVIKRGKFSWQLLWTGQKDCAYKNSYSCLGTTGTNILISQKDCASKLRAFCQADSDAQKRAMMFPFAGSSTAQLPQFKRDLANFMLTRGPHAFIGHSWKGCR